MEHVAGQSNLRRSIRILEKGLVIKSYITKRGTRNATKVARAKEIKKTTEEVTVLTALQDEVLAANPLQEAQIRQLNTYCGVANASADADGDLHEEVRHIADTMTFQAGEDGNNESFEPEQLGALEDDEDKESVMAALEFNSDEDLLDDEEEGGATSA